MWIVYSGTHGESTYDERLQGWYEIGKRIYEEEIRPFCSEEPELPDERKLMFRTPGFHRMRTDWRSEDAVVGGWGRRPQYEGRSQDPDAEPGTPAPRALRTPDPRTPGPPESRTRSEHWRR